MKKLLLLASAFGLLLLTNACRKSGSDSQGAETITTPDSVSAGGVAPPMPEWARNATIYEVNIRQFSQEGTFRAVEEQLPRLKELGVDILWFMPVHPSGKAKPEDSLSNPYAVTNYMAVDSAYGKTADFKALVKRAHDLGLRVIMDWVPNHTGWEHPWVKDHPEYYTKINGKIASPLDDKGQPSDLTYVADLNYGNAAMRLEMIKAMKYWVKECDIDGFRCGVAGMVPDDFWAQARPALDSVKTMFMLAESESDPKQFSSFNMNYGWGMYTVLKAIAQGARPATSIDTLIAHNRSKYPPWYFQMLFTQNQDINRKFGTLKEIFGQGAETFVVLTSTLEGMPLVYNGMEANLDKRLPLSEREPISWGDYSKAGLYKSLLTLKHRNRALWNGTAGGKASKIPTDHDEAVYAFYRAKEIDRIVVITNLTDQPQLIRLTGEGFDGIYTEIFTRQPTELKSGMSFSLKPWEYRVYTN